MGGSSTQEEKVSEWRLDKWRVIAMVVVVCAGLRFADAHMGLLAWLFQPQSVV